MTCKIHKNSLQLVYSAYYNGYYIRILSFYTDIFSDNQMHMWQLDCYYRISVYYINNIFLQEWTEFAWLAEFITIIIVPIIVFIT